MTRERYKRVVEIFQAASERSAIARPAFLAEACAGDDDLRRDVEAMLAADAQSGGFLSKPADDLAAAAVVARETRSLLGHRISHYEVVSLLGLGGMGEVYLARDVRLNRLVALKVLARDLGSNPELKKRFEREARAVSNLNHPHICTVHDVGEEDGIDFIVMEYVSGQTLEHLIPNKGLPLKQAVKYGLALADAVVAAHEAHIIHRDLKPSNVMVTDEGRIKILDFGLAKLAERQHSSDEGSTKSLTTQAGMIFGTAGYMSPEQAHVMPK